MNILYIAYSCDPYQGSEDKIGWCVPFESAKTNQVFVITKEEQRKSIEKYCETHRVQNIRFFYVDIPKVYKTVFRGFLYSGRLNIWHRYAKPLAEHICKDYQIEIIHQITPVEFRAIGQYYKIPGIKFVCGPLGGGEAIPKGLIEYAKNKMLIEITRSAINFCCKQLLRMRKTLSRCDKVIFANDETKMFLCSINDRENSNVVFSEIGLSRNEFHEFDSSNSSSNKESCVFLVSGRMVYRKGHSFLLDALERLPANLEYECRIVGNGPEQKLLMQRCSNNEKLSKHIVFTGHIPYEMMEEEYRNADVLIMPSIRETTGTVLLEAMSKGLPVITINKFGGAVLLDRESSWLYSGNSRISYIDSLKNAILECILDREEVKRRGKKAHENAQQHTWDKKVRYYQEIYQNLLTDEGC